MPGRRSSLASNPVLVSAVSVWEIAIKASIGRLQISHADVVKLPRLIETTGFDDLPIDGPSRRRRRCPTHASPRPIRPVARRAGPRRGPDPRHHRPSHSRLRRPRPLKRRGAVSQATTTARVGRLRRRNRYRSSRGPEAHSGPPRRGARRAHAVLRTR